MFWSYLLKCSNKLCLGPCGPSPRDCCSLQPKKWSPYHSHIASHAQAFLKHKDTGCLHGETSSSTVCANGKQKCLMVSPVRIVYLPFTQKTSIYQRDQDEFDPIIIPRWRWRIANGRHIFHSDISVGNFWLPFKTFRLFRKLSGRSSQNCLTIYILTEIFLGKWLTTAFSLHVSIHNFSTF